MNVKWRLLISTAVGLAALPRVGVAQSPGPLSPSPSPWTGAYGGIQFGWADNASRSVGCAFTGASPCSPDGTPAINTGGVLGGIEAGYNWQQGSWLLGAEADIDTLGLFDTQHFPGADDGYYSNGAKISSSYDWLGTVRGRAGLAVGRTLFFGTAGFAAAGVNQLYSDLNGNTASASRTRDGWTVGGGLEYGLSEKFSIKAEYLFVDLPSSTLTVNNYDVYGGYGGTSALKFRNDLNVVRAGINFHF